MARISERSQTRGEGTAQAVRHGFVMAGTGFHFLAVLGYAG